MKKHILFTSKFLTGCSLIALLVGCSSPATPEDIRAAISECSDVSWHVEFELRECYGPLCHNPSPLTKRKLRGFVSDCIAEREKRADPSSPENVLKRQRAAVGG